MQFTSMASTLVLSGDELLWNFYLIINNGGILMPSCLPFQGSNIRTKNFLGDFDIVGGDRIVVNDIHSQHCLEIIDGRRPERVIQQIMSQLGPLKLSIGVEAFVLFHTVDQ